MFCIQNFRTHNSFWLKGAERSALTPSLLRYSFVHSDPGVHIPYWTHRDIFKEISSVYLLDQTATFVCQYNSAVLAALLSLLASARAIACGCTLSSFTLTGGCASRRPLTRGKRRPALRRSKDCAEVSHISSWYFSWGLFRETNELPQRWLQWRRVTKY